MYINNGYYYHLNNTYYVPGTSYFKYMYFKYIILFNPQGFV